MKKIKYYLLLSIIFSLLLIGPDLGQAAEQSVTLTWTTDTYVPLNYQGKALPSRGSNIEVVAQLDSPLLNPNELNFNWFINHHIQKEGSGINKQIFRFNIGESVSKNKIIKVEISNLENTINISSSLSLKVYDPEIVLIAKKPPFGFSSQYKFSDDQEIEFTAQPYFFDIKDINELDYQWSFGKQIAKQTNNENLNNFVLKIGELVSSINQNLQVFVKNIKNPIQRTQATANIILIP